MGGIAKKVKPQQLWESRAAYKECPLSIFQKHIYQERTKQLATSYWQHKWNKNAREKIEQEEEMLKDWNQVQENRKVQELSEDLGTIDLGDT